MSKRLSDHQINSQGIDRSVELVEMMIRPKLREIPTPVTVRVWEWATENWVFMFFLTALVFAGMVMSNG